VAISLPIVSEWNPAGVTKAVADFKRLETAGEKASFAIGKAALPAAAAIGGLAVAGFSAVKAFAEDDAAAQKLATTLNNVTGATDAQVTAVEDFISKTSQAAAVADDELRPAFDSLVRGTGDVTQAQDLLGLALDISAGTGKDLGLVSDALSKAYNGNFAALKKLDPALAGLIAEGADADTVFGRLAGTFEGQASKQANTTAGQFKGMSIALEETKESIGAALLPIVNKLLPKLQSLGQFVQQNTGLIVTLGLVIGTLAGAILAINAGLGIYNTIQAVTAALNTALTTSFSALWVATGAVVILGIVAALIALQAKFDIFGKTIDFLKGVFKSFWEYIKLSFDNVKNIAVGVFDSIGGAVATWYGGVRKYIDALYSAFKTVFNGIAKIWNNTIGKLSFKVPDWVPGIGGKGFDVPDIPMLAEGGIVTGPTLAMIGEAGPEAVIPLNKAGMMGGDTFNIYMPVGSNGDELVRTLQRHARRNGNVPLATTTAVRR
jgi:hypothetical protein